MVLLPIRQKYGLLTRILLVVLLMVFSLTIARQWFESDRVEVRDWLPDGRPERCLRCHADLPDPSASHPVASFGCSCCHLGDPLATDKERAHAGMVVRPGDLSFAWQTCGQEQCHPRQVYRVLNSVMTTNSGFLDRLARLFGETLTTSAATVVGVEELVHDPDHYFSFRSVQLYAKLCASCHLWKERTAGEDEYSRKGGGCAACHSRQRSGHQEITLLIDNDRCIPCHNRSGRIGLSFTGLVEGPQYGTPFRQGVPGAVPLSGERYATVMTPDIHHEKGLLCIDCHTDREVMGDGQRHRSKKDQLDTRCEDCHGSPGQQAAVIETDDQMRGRMKLQPHLAPHAEGQRRHLVTRSQTPLYHTFLEGDGSFVLIGKKDGKAHPIRRPGQDGIHDSPIHRRLRCQPCHSHASPQCYGCHITYNPAGSQYNHLTMTHTAGEFKETRDFSRSESPTLGIDAGQRITLVVPAMHVSFTNEAESGQNFTSLRYAALAPHTTRKAARSCFSCHLDSRTWGRGSGLLNAESTGEATPAIRVSPLMNVPSGAAPPDGWASGSQQCDLKSGEVRCLNDREIARIVAAGRCALCHEDWKDPLYTDYEGGLKRFHSGSAACPAARGPARATRVHVP